MNQAAWRTMTMCAVVAALLTGCGAATEADDAEDAVTTSTATSNESALVSSAGEGTSAMSSLSDAQIAEAASGNLKGKYKSGCVTSTQKLNVVTYVMDHCTGPYGLVTVTGTMVVTYTREANASIKAVASGTGLKVNDGTLDLDATAVYSKNAAGLETAVVETHGKGTGAKGHTGERVGNYTLTRDQAAGCVTLAGQWSTQFEGSRAKTSTEVSGLQKCTGACPAAGGIIKHTGVGGKVLTLTLDGSAVASWSSTGGKSGTVDLQCK